MSKNDDELNEFIDKVTDGTICMAVDGLTGGRTVFLSLESPVM
jgi:hypothetical protein